MLPICSIKSPTFFTKFNSLGIYIDYLDSFAIIFTVCHTCCVRNPANDCKEVSCKTQRLEIKSFENTIIVTNNFTPVYSTTSINAKKGKKTSPSPSNDIKSSLSHIMFLMHLIWWSISSGTLAVIYIIIFVIIKASIWGINMDFSDTTKIPGNHKLATGLNTYF